jgi:serine/threonine protein kinase
MGEVHRARDTRLGRDVAIKALPAEVAHESERLARFRREAHLLASLNHPGIAAIHGLEEADGQPLLVLELVEGETLAERIARGQVPLDEALGIARQVAEALEEAHEHGIVHRDLKPANVKLTPEGKVKVLDFGLAKARDVPSAGRRDVRVQRFGAVAGHATRQQLGGLHRRALREAPDLRAAARPQRGSSPEGREPSVRDLRFARRPLSRCHRVERRPEQPSHR